MAKLSGWSFDWAERGSCLPSFRRLAMSHLLLDTGALKTTEGKAEVPSLDKEGWLRPLRKCREASLAGADGVVGSSHRLSEVERTTQAAPPKERGYFLMARPPLLCQGGDFGFPAGCPRHPWPGDV